MLTDGVITETSTMINTNKSYSVYMIGPRGTNENVARISYVEPPHIFSIVGAINDFAPLKFFHW